jgi:hypothetical protein
MFTRKTYESREAQYVVDRNRLGDIIKDINAYIKTSSDTAYNDNPHWFSKAHLRGKGRNIVLEAEDDETRCDSFPLAELVFNDEFSTLTFRVNSGLRVSVPSEDLHTIAQKYLLRN